MQKKRCFSFRSAMLTASSNYRAWKCANAMGAPKYLLLETYIESTGIYCCNEKKIKKIRHQSVVNRAKNGQTMLRFKITNKKPQDVITLALKITQPCKCDFKFVYNDGEKSHLMWLTAPQRCIGPASEIKITQTFPQCICVSLKNAETSHCRVKGMNYKSQRLISSFIAF